MMSHASFSEAMRLEKGITEATVRLSIGLEHHEDLLDPTLWQETQDRLRQGELIRIYPYRPNVQLRGRRTEP